jgi:hypothetical protein
MVEKYPRRVLLIIPHARIFVMNNLRVEARDIALVGVPVSLGSFSIPTGQRSLPPG